MVLVVIQRYFKTIALAIIAGLILVYYPTVGAVDTLSNPKDVISNQMLGALAKHSIRFGIPVSSSPIDTTDYIQINFPFFSNITAPTNIGGDFLGTPVITMVGNRVRITGIAIRPGSYITVDGISADNPENEQQFDVGILITKDISASIIKNQADIMATITDGSISVYATVSAPVGNLRISGTGSPGMFVTFSEAGNVIGTAVANNAGQFSQVFLGLTPDIHTISLFGTDLANRTTPPFYIKNIAIRAYETLSVTDIVLAPTISINKDQISKGEELVISGSGPPNYKVIVFSEAPLSSYETNVGSDGNYTYTLANTQELDYGDHQVYSLVQDGTGAQSQMSSSLFFKVIDSTPPDGGHPECNISKGDLNCDNQVNLTDFAMILYYWGATNAEADVNSDGVVNLVDFSIMMFYWQGS